MKKPMVWTIAAVDPAGTHVDIETLKNFNVGSYSIRTTVTGQNEAIADALQYALKPNAIKIGMIGASSTHEKIAHFLQNYSGFVVLDSILASSSGTPLFFSNVKQHLESLAKLFPYVDIVTPNLIEAEKILNHSLTSYQDIQEGAHAMLALGAKSVLLKGGHVKDDMYLAKIIGRMDMNLFGLRINDCLIKIIVELDVSLFRSCGLSCIGSLNQGCDCYCENVRNSWDPASVGY